MQVALVSTDGVNVDDHFGRADRFLIYEMDEGVRRPLAIRIIEPFSDGDKSHEFNGGKFSGIAEHLAGCERLYCTRIGEKPAAELKKLGIEPVTYEGPIENITV